MLLLFEEKLSFPWNIRRYPRGYTRIIKVKRLQDRNTGNIFPLGTIHHLMDPLSDTLNLRILRSLLSGDGVSINISVLSKKYDIHRATAKKKMDRLVHSGTISHPTYPFPKLYDLYPLVILVWADIPRTQQAMDFFNEDSHIFAAFSCMEGPYNTFLIEYFEDMESYNSWRKSIITDNRLPSRSQRAPANAHMLSTKLCIKNAPSVFIERLARKSQECGTVSIDGVEMDRTDFDMLTTVMKGNCIRTNDSHIAKQVGVHRKTVSRRISTMMDEGILAPPRCSFPHLLAPPGYNMVLSLIEVRRDRDAFRKMLLEDGNVPRAYDTITGRYNFAVFSAFEKIDDFFEWGENIQTRFAEDIGAFSNTVMSSRMVHTIQQQKVSLGYVERRMRGPL